MKKVVKPAMLTMFSLSLIFSSLPASANNNEITRNAGELKIESKEGLSLRSASLVKKLSELNSSSKLVIIQLDGPVQEEWEKKLEDAGAELGDYIPDFAFVAKLRDKKDRQEILKLSFVKRVTPFHSAYKLDPELAKELDSKKRQKVVVVGFDKKNDISKTAKTVASKLDDVQRSSVKRIATVSATGNEIEKLLESDDVIAIVPVNERHYSNDVARGIIHSDVLASTGYTGKNQIVGVADSGLDTGKISTLHPDLADRVKKLIAVGRPNDPSDMGGHGTHVAGSIVGTGKASDGKIKGMAPDAKLVFHSMDDKDQQLTGDLYKMWTEAYQEGARIHSDSWGTEDFGEYGYESKIADTFLWEHKDMTALFAAGNQGERGWYTVGSPATAKNVISVGASENYRPDYTISDNINDIAYFSSNGPTADNRLKPDIVAPGTFILSTRSSLAPDDSFWDVYDKYYAFMGGTSMATPILAGGTAQVRQFLQDSGNKNPSSALIKSMLLTGADYIPEISLFTQGFGRANLEAAIQTTFVDESKGLATGGNASYTINVTDTTKPFIVTLAWTDYPASLIAQRTLVNDLNLVAVSPSGKVYNGNDFGDPPFDDHVDNLNNVEQIYCTPEKGNWTVKVTGYNIPYGPQPYAISTNGKLSNTTTPGVKEETKTGTVTTTSGTGKKRYIEYSISVKKKGKVKATLNWDGDADLTLSLKNNKNKEVAKSATKNKPEELEYDVTTTGTYKVRVYAESGTGKFTLNMSYPSN